MVVLCLKHTVCVLYSQPNSKTQSSRNIINIAFLFFFLAFSSARYPFALGTKFVPFTGEFCREALKSFCYVVVNFYISIIVNIE